jgi:hypothetical protein
VLKALSEMSFPRKAKNPRKLAILKILTNVIESFFIKTLTDPKSFKKSWIPACAGMTSTHVQTST